MLASVQRLPSERVALEDLPGRTLAEDVRATRDQPPFDAAVMDGYALRAADTPGVLRIIGESAAGSAFQTRLSAREAVRISTGAPLPAGADAVLAQEDAKVSDAALEAPQIPPASYVRLRGGDFVRDQVLLSSGRRLDAGAIALLAGAGLPDTLVSKRPRVAIISNGDELVRPGDPVRDDQIYDSASPAVAAIAAAWGAEANYAGPIADQSTLIVEALSNALEAADIVVMIGGASVGPHDHARPAMTQLGAEIVLQGILVRPGRPTWFARTKRGSVVLGLPGNPASALVCARLFLAPLLEKMLSGAAAAAVERRIGLLTCDLPANGGREAYMRAVENNDERIAPFRDEDSSMLHVLADSNALLRREIRSAPAGSGDRAEYLRWTP